MLMPALEIIVLILLSYYLRRLYAINKKTDITDDSYNHYYYLMTQKGESFLNFDFKGALYKTYIGYPRLQHFLVSRFSPNRYLKVGQFLVVFYDVVHTLLVYFLSLFFNFILFDKNYTFDCFLIALFFTVTPVLYGFSARLIGFSNARTLGNLLFFIQVIIWFFIMVYSQYWLLLPAFLIYYLVIVSSFFALQSTIFFFIGLSIGFTELIPVLFFLISTTLLYTIKHGGVKRVLEFKLNHWIWYFRNVKKGTSANQRNSFRILKDLPYLFLKDFKFFLYQSFKYVTPIIFVVLIPASIFYFLNLRYENAYPEAFGYFQTVFLSLFVAFILTSIPGLLFLGEAERYMEYAISSLSILFLFLVHENVYSTQFLVILIFFNLSLVLFLFLYTKPNLLEDSKLLSEEDQLMFNELNEFLQGLNHPRILTIPIKMARFLAAMNIDSDVLFYQRFMAPPNKIDGFKDFELDTLDKNMELPILDLKKLKDKYGLTHLLINNGINDNKRIQVQEYKLQELKKVFSNKHFELLVFE